MDDHTAWFLTEQPLQHFVGSVPTPIINEDELDPIGRLQHVLHLTEGVG